MAKDWNNDRLPPTDFQLFGLSLDEDSDYDTQDDRLTLRDDYEDEELDETGESPIGWDTYEGWK